MSEDLQARIEALEGRVEHLYSLLGERPQAPGATAGAGGAPNNFPPEVVELALSGRKVEAIKVLRERTGLGLAEAKQVVDSIV